MKVLLVKDVYKLGRAGDVKKVADGYGRNFLLPQGLAVLATSGALNQIERIRTQANDQRAVLNKEMCGIAEQLSKLVLVFPAKAGDTGKLYGSITPQMVVDAIKAKSGIEINRRQMDSQPIRTLGTFNLHVRLTVDLIPTVTVIVHREGETLVLDQDEAETAVETPAATPAATVAEVEPVAVAEAVEAVEAAAAE